MRLLYINELTFQADKAKIYTRKGAKMNITNISDAKDQLPALVEKVIAGQEVIIGKAGKPVVKLVRYESIEKPRTPGALKGQIKIADDFDKLPADISEAFGIKDE